MSDPADTYDGYPDPDEERRAERAMARSETWLTVKEAMLNGGAALGAMMGAGLVAAAPYARRFLLGALKFCLWTGPVFVLGQLWDGACGLWSGITHRRKSVRYTTRTLVAGGLLGLAATQLPDCAPEEEPVRAPIVENAEPGVFSRAGAGLVEGVNLSRGFNGFALDFVELFDDWGPDLRNGQPNTTPYNEGDYAVLTNQAEGTGQNPLSTARGKYQFLQGTWRKTVRACAPEMSHLSDDQVEDLRGIDDAFKERMFWCFTNGNIAYFTREVGQRPSPGQVYLMHNQGPAGAVALLRNPGANAVEVLMRLHGCGRTLSANDTRKYKELSKAEQARLTIAEQAVLKNSGTSASIASNFSWQKMKRFDREPHFLASQSGYTGSSLRNLLGF